jgi:hypothetical protein
MTSKRLRFAGVVFATMIAIGSPFAFESADAQPSEKPSASAHPAASTSAHPAASASAHTTASASAPAASASAAPPAPPASPHSSAMPHGHGANPHGGEAPHARDRFEAPADGSEESTELPPGTILLMIADRDEVPIAGIPIVVSILHSSVAKGDSSEKLDGITDVAGMVKLDGLEVGSANSYGITATVGAAKFALRPFQLGEKAGKRALIHIYDAAEDLDVLEQQGPFGLESEIRTSLHEDDIVVRHRCRLYNFTPVAWLADVEIPLPKGFRAFQTPDEWAGAPVQIMETEHGAVLRGTVAPGTSDLVFGYHIPLNGDPSQSFDLAMFPNTVGVGMVAEASKKMSLTAEGFSQPQFTKDEEGLSVLVAARQASAETGPVTDFRVTLNGLPTRGPGGLIATILAAIALGTAGAYRLARRGRTDLEPEARRDLVEARETLLKEIAALEEAYKKGVVGPRTYERSRELLLDALARIVARIDGPLPPPEASAPPPAHEPVEATDAG